MWVSRNGRKFRDRGVRKEAELEWGDVRETPSAIAGFRRGRGPSAKKCGQILEAETDKKTIPTEEHSPTDISFR